VIVQCAPVRFVFVIGLAAVACNSDRRTYALRSNVGPDHALIAEVSLKIPDGWPKPTVNDKLGWPRFDFGGGTSVGIATDEIHTATAKERVEQFDKNQLFRSEVERIDMPDGSRWVIDRDTKGTWASLIIPGPKDSLVICHIAAIKPGNESLLERSRSFCQSLTVASPST